MARCGCCGSVTRAGWDGLSAVVGRRSCDWLAFSPGLDELLAEGRVLAAGDAGDGGRRSAEAQLHGVGVFAADNGGAFEAGDGVEIEAVDEVVNGLHFAVVEMVPGADEGVAIEIGEDGVDLGEVDALGGVWIHEWHALAAAEPAGSPHVLGNVVVEGGEEGGRGAVRAVVVEGGGLSGCGIEKGHPVKPAQVESFEQRRNGVRGEGDVPDGEGVGVGRRLGRGAEGGDDQRRVILNADFADGGPLFGIE